MTTSGSPGTASTAPTTTCATRVSARATWRRSPRAACAQACTPPGTGGRSSTGEGSRIGWMGNPPVCLDIEVHDISYVLGCLRRWRQLRPTRETDWTLEGMQGGLL